MQRSIGLLTVLLLLASGAWADYRVPSTVFLAPEMAKAHEKAKQQKKYLALMESNEKISDKDEEIKRAALTFIQKFRSDAVIVHLNAADLRTLPSNLLDGLNNMQTGLYIPRIVFFDPFTEEAIAGLGLEAYDADGSRSIRDTKKILKGHTIDETKSPAAAPKASEQATAGAPPAGEPAAPSVPATAEGSESGSPAVLVTQQSWKDRFGNSIEAALVRVEDGIGIFRKMSGEELKCPIADLDSAGQEQVKQALQGGSAAE